MAQDADRILAEALRLAPEERAFIAVELVASLDPDVRDQVNDQGTWVAEIERRARAGDCGQPGGVLVRGTRPDPRSPLELVGGVEANALGRCRGSYSPQADRKVLVETFAGGEGVCSPTFFRGLLSCNVPEFRARAWGPSASGSFALC
jgi:hypothetical protein